MATITLSLSSGLEIPRRSHHLIIFGSPLLSLKKRGYHSLSIVVKIVINSLNNQLIGYDTLKRDIWYSYNIGDYKNGTLR